MLSVGTVLQDRYRIERVLGRGGMGAVYLATHLELDRPVAVKQLWLDGGPLPPEALRQFRLEARLLHDLRHPNLPQVHDFLELEGLAFLVMDYIAGRTLEEVLISDGLPAESRVLGWARQLGEVLRYLHQHRPPVIFRDLKPANVMLTDAEEIKLIDFGIAKLHDPDLGVGTRTMARGQVSRGYAAPEQYAGGTDALSDVYALGATLFTLLTCEVPPESVDVATGQAPPVDVRRSRPQISERTAVAVQAMMQVDRTRRPGSVADAMGRLLPEAGAPRRMGLNVSTVPAPQGETRMEGPGAALEAPTGLPPRGAGLEAPTGHPARGAAREAPTGQLAPGGAPGAAIEREGAGQRAPAMGSSTERSAPPAGQRAPWLPALIGVAVGAVLVWLVSRAPDGPVGDGPRPTRTSVATASPTVGGSPVMSGSPDVSASPAPTRGIAQSPAVAATPTARPTVEAGQTPVALPTAAPNPVPRPTPVRTPVIRPTPAPTRPPPAAWRLIRPGAAVSTLSLGTPMDVFPRGGTGLPQRDVFGTTVLVARRWGLGIVPEAGRVAMIVVADPPGADRRSAFSTTGGITVGSSWVDVTREFGEDRHEARRSGGLDWTYRNQGIGFHLRDGVVRAILVFPPRR